MLLRVGCFAAQVVHHGGPTSSSNNTPQQRRMFALRTLGLILQMIACFGWPEALFFMQATTTTTKTLMQTIWTLLFWHPKCQGLVSFETGYWEKGEPREGESVGVQFSLTRAILKTYGGCLCPFKALFDVLSHSWRRLVCRPFCLPLFRLLQGVLTYSFVL